MLTSVRISHDNFINIYEHDITMNKATTFTAKVCGEGKSLKVYIPAPNSNYIGIMRGDIVELKIIKVRSERRV